MEMKRTPPPITEWCRRHSKWRHNSRKLAKAAIRNTPDRKGMREYPCNARDGFWHVGHLPQATVYGLLTAREVYGAKR